MKKYLQLLIVLLFIQKAGGQIVFCPAGAEWNYSFHGASSSSYNNLQNETITYGKDSVEGNESIKILYHKRFFRYHNWNNVSQSHIKQKGDTVFVRSPCTANKWQILYNFAALAGQSWKIVVYPFLADPTFSITYTVSVDSVSFVNINNFNFKRLYVTYTSNRGDSNASIITERLGCDAFMFNYRNSFSTAGESLSENLCYKDDAFGLTQFTEKPCDYTFNVGIKENNYQNSNIKIFPNPASDFFFISNANELTQGALSLSIHDLSGREIKRIVLKNLNSDPTKIDISDLAKGFYVLKLSNNNEVIYTGNLVKTD